MASSPPAPVIDVVADAVYENAVDDPKCYPKDTDAFMKALQDEGVQNKNRVQEYKPLMKVVAPVQVRLKAAYPGCGMLKNATDARRAIAFACVRIRAHRDTAEVEESLRKYAADGSTKVFVIGSGTDRGGFGIVLQGLLSYWTSKISAATLSQRAPNDALRLAGIMCDPEERESIQKVMSNKKGARPQSDQADDTFTAYFVTALVKFKDRAYILDPPANIQKIEGHAAFDANDVSATDIVADKVGVCQ